MTLYIVEGALASMLLTKQAKRAEQLVAKEKIVNGESLRRVSFSCGFNY